MKWKGFERKYSQHNQGTITIIASRHWVKPRRTSIRIAADPAEVRKEHLKNTVTKRLKEE
jgi:ribosomal protein L20A (L18A)